MKTNKKHIWNNPTIQTIEEKKISKEIIVSACSKYSSGCHPAAAHLDSIPGFKPEIM